MKEILSLLLALIMAATMLAGCGVQETKPAAQPASQSGAAQTAEKDKVVVACWAIRCWTPIPSTCATYSQR